MEYLILLPKSASVLDQWSDRAIRISCWEGWLAMLRVVVSFVIYSERLGFQYEDPLMPYSNWLVAIPTIFLPMASCSPSLLGWYRSLGVRRPPGTNDASQRVPVEPLYFCLFQLLQLAACTWLTAYNFVQFSTRTVDFWLSLVCCLIPASTGFTYALVGMARLYFAGAAQRTLRRQNMVIDEYLDHTVEHGPLEQAYQQQQADEAVGSDITVTIQPDGSSPATHEAQMQHLQHQDLQHHESHDTNRQDAGAARQEVEDARAQGRQERDGPPPPVSPLPEVRFRWQEASGIRNGSYDIWSPITGAAGSSVIWGVWYKYIMRSSSFSPELARFIVLQAVVPMTISALSTVFIISSVKRPRYVLIFTSFCLSSLATVIWILLFIYSLGDFLYRLPTTSYGFSLISFGLILVALGMVLSHLGFLRCIVKMEWSPDYSSLSKEFDRLRQRRRNAGAAT